MQRTRSVLGACAPAGLSFRSHPPLHGMEPQSPPEQGELGMRPASEPRRSVGMPFLGMRLPVAWPPEQGNWEALQERSNGLRQAHAQRLCTMGMESCVCQQVACLEHAIASELRGWLLACLSPTHPGSRVIAPGLWEVEDAAIELPKLLVRPPPSRRPTAAPLSLWAAQSGCGTGSAATGGTSHGRPRTSQEGWLSC